MMKALALVVSARKQGNCFDFAKFSLDHLEESGLKTELVNFHDFKITPCQGCNYECIQHIDTHRGKDSPCPIRDDVLSIWKKTWNSDILLLFVPTYGGLPPALWLAFSQRYQAYYHQAPEEDLKRTVISTVLIAPPHQSSGAPWIYSLMGEEIKGLGRKVVGFEVINPVEYMPEYTFHRLIDHEEIQRRLVFMTDRTLDTAIQIRS